MPSKFDFAEWWNKETRKGTPVVVKMENPNNWSMLELSSPEDDFNADKDKGKNAKQLTWVMLLRAHQAAGCVAWLGHGLLTLLSAVKTRLILRQGAALNAHTSYKGKLYKFIKVFLAFAIFMLAFDVVAHMKGWHFSRPHLHIPDSTDIRGLLHSTYISWVNVRANYLAPPLQSLANACIVLFLIQSLDRMTQCLGCVWVKLKKIKPVPTVQSFDSGDLEHPDLGYPMVLIQIPAVRARFKVLQGRPLFCMLRPHHRDQMRGDILFLLHKISSLEDGNSTIPVRFDKLGSECPCQDRE